MSRNKAILIIAALIITYLLLPATGTGGVIKANMLALAPYALLFIIIYLAITINVLKKSLYKLNDEVNEQNTINVAKMMNVTFDVKRFMGTDNLIQLYSQVNLATNVPMDAKELLYNAMRRKRVDIPVPTEGKREIKSAGYKGRPNPNKKKKRR